MTINIIRAIYKFRKNPITTLSYRSATTRYVCWGDPLESYAKDFFCNSFHKTIKKRETL